jgi:hypothetical protein
MFMSELLPGPVEDRAVVGRARQPSRRHGTELEGIGEYLEGERTGSQHQIVEDEQQCPRLDIRDLLGDDLPAVPRDLEECREDGGLRLRRSLERS